MNGLGYRHVEFGMYPFQSVAWAWDELWAAVQRQVPWAPETLTRSGDVHARWYDADCLVTHVCGWPFAALHRNDMQLVGAFSLDIEDADGDGFYRSVLLSPSDVELSDLVAPTSRAVANSADSLSGWISLLSATVGPTGTWPGHIAFTSAHYDSLRALQKGEADVACVDSWTLALIRAEEPELVAGLHRVGYGPRIPTPAITARATISPKQLDALRAAFAAASAAPETAAARAVLRITGFVRHDLDVYLSTLDLAATRPPE